MSLIFNVPKADTYPLIVAVPKATLVNYATGLALFSKLWFYGKYGVNDLDSAALFKKDLTSGVSVLVAGSPTVDGSLQVVLQPVDTTTAVDTPISIQCALKGYDGTNWYTIELDVVLLIAAQATSKVS